MRPIGLYMHRSLQEVDRDGSVLPQLFPDRVNPGALWLSARGQTAKLVRTKGGF
jgi:hypothetical protein